MAAMAAPTHTLSSLPRRTRHPLFHGKEFATRLFSLPPTECKQHLHRRCVEWFNIIEVKPLAKSFPSKRNDPEVTQLHAMPAASLLFCPSLPLFFQFKLRVV